MAQSSDDSHARCDAASCQACRQAPAPRTAALAFSRLGAGPATRPRPDGADPAADADESTTAAATSRIVSRLSIDVFWIHRNGVRLGQAELRLQQALGPVDELAGLEPVGQVGDLGLERGDLLRAG